MTRPAQLDARQGSFPGAQPAECIGGFNVTGANCYRRGNGFARGKIAQQGTQETGNRCVTRSGRANNIYLETLF